MNTNEIKQNALHFEAACQLKPAIELYESYAFTESSDQESIVNLLCIYFEVQDYGIQVHHGLNGEYAGHCYQKMLELIEHSKQLYPQSVQLQFWSDYAQYTYWGNVPHDTLNEKLYTSQTETLDPFFAFGNRYPTQSQALYAQVKDKKTFRERYIAGILESWQI